MAPGLDEDGCEIYGWELEQYQPAIAKASGEAVAKGYRDLDFCRLDEAAFAACPSDSIDYAVMEKTSHAVVVPADIGWSDVGSWSALWVRRSSSMSRCVRS